jgi:hypothetical protein
MASSCWTGSGAGGCRQGKRTCPRRRPSLSRAPGSALAVARDLQVPGGAKTGSRFSGATNVPLPDGWDADRCATVDDVFILNADDGHERRLTHLRKMSPGHADWGIAP